MEPVSNRELLMAFTGEHIKCFNILLLLLLIAPFMPCCSSDGDDGYFLLNHPLYHSPEDLENFLHEKNREYPDITYLEPVGSSIEGRTIWAFVLSDSPLNFEGEPRIRLVGSIHGDENVTTEVLIHLIGYITDNYSNSQYIRNLVDNRYIVIIPMMNPDGVVHYSRYNANYVDLNRNFEVEWMAYSHHGSFPFSEIETQSLRDYSIYMGFHLSISYHSGAVIVNMPFDYASEHRGGDIPQENDLVNFLAQVYSTNGRFLETEGLLDSSYVHEGTINGGDWYIAYGTLQDWSYIKTGCIDLTVEIAKEDPKNSQEIGEIFELNRDSVLSYIEAAGIGVYGRVVCSSNNEISISANITIDGGDIKIRADDYGYYHRMVLPGNYIITFKADEYEEYSQEIEVEEASPLRLDVFMDRI